MPERSPSWRGCRPSVRGGGASGLSQWLCEAWGSPLSLPAGCFFLSVPHGPTRGQALGTQLAVALEAGLARDRMHVQWELWGLLSSFQSPWGLSWAAESQAEPQRWEAW